MRGMRVVEREHAVHIHGRDICAGKRRNGNATDIVLTREVK